MTQAPTPGPLSGNFSVEEYVAEYEFRGDEGFHTPNDDERALITDAIHGYLSEASYRLAPTAPVEASGSERWTEDMVWPESPLANDLYQHIQSQFCLHPDEAAEETGEVLSILAKQGVDPTKLPLNLRPQPSGETLGYEIGGVIQRLTDCLNDATKDNVSVDTGDLRALLSARPLALGGQS